MLQFTTKATTLECLSSVLKSARILPLYFFTLNQWRKENGKILKTIEQKNWFERSLVVRSSGLSEDRVGESLAGRFLSVLDVRGKECLSDAVEKVYISLCRDKSVEEDQILIQPMLENVKISGVAFSKDPNTGAPYIVINYDDSSGSTTSVTSGQTNSIKTFYWYRNQAGFCSSPLNKVISLISELEEIFGVKSLDIEFAFGPDDELYLFQVRGLGTSNNRNVDMLAHRDALSHIHRRIYELNKPHPYLYGSRTIFGVMPDWNPAEIIGIRPRPLSLSIYKEMVTDNIWAYQRHNYGYRNLRSFPLLQHFSGLPYVDVRVDFNSFLPSDLDEGLARRLTDYYINRLVDFPVYHDKVEFEIIYSCYTMDLPERLESLQKYGFGKDDISVFADSLRNLTNRIINTKTGLWRKDLERIGDLEKRREKILESGLDEVSRIYWLLEDCKRYGTLPFAGLARAAFIAVQMLRSLVNTNILKTDEYQNFMSGLGTISSRLNGDLEKFGKDAFLQRYGHLRPGTYDILCPRYDEEPDLYFDWTNRSDSKRTDQKKNPGFVLSLAQMKKIEGMLHEHRLELDILSMFDFIKESIEGREYAKFVFTRSISDAISLFKSMANRFGFSTEDASFANIKTIYSLYCSSTDPIEAIGQSIEEGKNRYVLTKSIVLPPLIINPEDVWSFHTPPVDPNFITLEKAVGKVVFTDTSLSELKHGILFIPNADPGFDWIFSHSIAGFVTMYGGINSHMAIRAGELGIPAVIGAGETLFTRWSKAEILEIDCANHQVRINR